MPWSMVLPYYDPARFNHEDSYARLSRLVIEDQKVEFYQCRQPMPNAMETDRIVRMVQTRRPSFVFSLGHSNLAADVCADVVTVASMPFGTNLPRARSSVYVLPRHLRSDDAPFMRDWRITPPQIIETDYTFRLPERSASFTRAELHVPAEAYAIVIVGNRLDQEITDDVATYLTSLAGTEPRAFFVFMGVFSRYGEVCERHPALRERSVFLGYQQDVVAVFECCDAFFNPPRYGGGSAAAYAQAAGLPVLTLPGGDVANSVGEPFVFDSYDAITAFVRRAAAEPNVGRALADVARARFAQISDREAMLRTIVDGAAARADLRRTP
jgi:glycosyltransferase involved in cell wall biosynthesis